MKAKKNTMVKAVVGLGLAGVLVGGTIWGFNANAKQETQDKQQAKTVSVTNVEKIETKGQKEEKVKKKESPKKDKVEKSKKVDSKKIKKTDSKKSETVATNIEEKSQSINKVEQRNNNTSTFKTPVVASKKSYSSSNGSISSHKSYSQRKPSNGSTSSNRSVTGSKEAKQSTSPKKSYSHVKTPKKTSPKRSNESNGSTSTSNGKKTGSGDIKNHGGTGKSGSTYDEHTYSEKDLDGVPWDELNK